MSALPASSRASSPSLRDGQGPLALSNRPAGEVRARFGGGLGAVKRPRGSARTSAGHRVREGVAPVAHRLAGRERRGLEDRPQRRRATRAARCCAGTSSTATLDAGRAQDLAGPVGAGRAAGVDEVVDRRPSPAGVGERVLGDQLDDRVGDVAACRWGVPTSSRDDPAAARRRPGRGARPRAIFSGKSLPGGPWSHDVRTIASRGVRASVARMLRSPLRLDCAPYGLIGRALVVRARSHARRSGCRRTPRWWRPATRSTPAAAQASATSARGASPLRRGREVGLAGAAVDVGPGRGVDDDLRAVPRR